MRVHDLAQLNVGRLIAEPESPLVAEFIDALDPINSLAETSPGFVWRFQTDDGNAIGERPFDDDTILVNFSTWASVDALHGFVYRTAHADYLRRRREWFTPIDDVVTVLWWVPAGHEPSAREAVDRLEHLRTHGPTPTAFTFRRQFTPDGDAIVRRDADVSR